MGLGRVRIRRKTTTPMGVWKVETESRAVAMDHVRSLKERGYIRAADKDGFVAVGEYFAAKAGKVFRIRWRDEGDPAAPAEPEDPFDLSPRASLENLALPGALPICPHCGGKPFRRRIGPQICSSCSRVIAQPPAELVKALR